jgi:hypothetical protein
MANSSVRFTSFPRTKSSPFFVRSIVEVFKAHEQEISTVALLKGLESNQVLAILCDDLQALNFEVETGKTSVQKIHRPVLYGENEEPILRYEIDAYNSEWKCGLEIEAGRAILGNALFRDLFQAMVMVDVDYLCLAIPNNYKYRSGGKNVVGKDYEKAIAVADALYGHGRNIMPYELTIIGY